MTALSASPTPPHPLGPTAARTLIELEVLAPASGGVLRSFDPVRVTWVRLEEFLGSIDTLETPIHRAIREVEGMLKGGELRQAMTLSEVLALDLAIARWAGSTEALVARWDLRFPPASGAHYGKPDLDHLDAIFDRLLDAPEYTAAQSKLDALFMHRIWRSRFEPSESPNFIQGYESFEDMLEDLSMALDLETTFEVWFPKAARMWFNKRAPLRVVVSGPNTVGWLMTTLEELHPRLRAIDWRLQVAGKLSNQARDVILPNQRLYVVLPRSA